jgi:hypothetical protein
MAPIKTTKGKLFKDQRIVPVLQPELPLNAVMEPTALARVGAAPAHIMAALQSGFEWGITPQNPSSG